MSTPNDPGTILNKPAPILQFLQEVLGDLSVPPSKVLTVLWEFIPLIGEYAFQTTRPVLSMKLSYDPKHNLIKVWVNEVVALKILNKTTIEFTQAYAYQSPAQLRRWINGVLHIPAFVQLQLLNNSNAYVFDTASPHIAARYLKILAPVDDCAILFQIYDGLQITIEQVNKQTYVCPTSQISVTPTYIKALDEIAQVIKTFCWHCQVDTCLINFSLTAPFVDGVLDCSFELRESKDLQRLLKTLGYDLKYAMPGLKVQRQVVGRPTEGAWTNGVLTSVFTTRNLQVLLTLIRQCIHQHQLTPLIETSLALVILYEAEQDVVVETEYIAAATRLGLITLED